jgi:protein gp37
VGKNSEIEWTHHTFNPWWGCAKLSEACEHCYAEVWSKRSGSTIWGSRGTRRFFGDKHWQEPLAWNREAKNLQQRKRVFCASMADVFEDRRDLDKWRDHLWDLIGKTPWLDWLILTKRPENLAKMIPWTNNWPSNVWVGITAENQERAIERIPVLLKYHAPVRFVSCEPLLGPVDLSQWLNQGDQKHPSEGIDWVIVGGESGFKARPMHPVWARSLRDQCVAAHILFHFKQWGCWRPSDGGLKSKLRTIRVTHRDLEATTFIWKGKKAAGRDLDGRMWDEIPKIST